MTLDNVAMWVIQLSIVDGLFFTESTWTPRSTSSMLAPTNPLADMLTKGASCVMNGAIFFVCSTSWCFLGSLAAIFGQLKRQPHVEDKTRKKTKGELAVAKPRSVCLISTNLKGEQSFSFGQDPSNVPGSPQLDSGSVERSREKLRAKQKPKPSNVFSSVERRQTVSRELPETATKNWNPTGTDQVGRPQSASHILWVRWKSRHEFPL